MSTKTLYDAVVGPGANEWYGTLVVTNIRYDGDGAVTVQKFLGSSSFRRWMSVATTDINVLTNPWVQADPETTNEQIDSATGSVTAKLSGESSVSLTNGTIIDINGDLTKDPDNQMPDAGTLQFSDALQCMGETAAEISIRAEPFDLTNPAYADFPLCGIFTVLLGGGSTTGIVASVANPQPWVRGKLYTYMQNPIYFNEWE
ncbi:Uncharacterized protein TCAP_03020 [Tolypocladium capitatum]|uniref:Uncharacterized protein n=1 Tax=Tolypocladium capitatum TaxID=45235 RepID=A0A2K3QHK5_9HYPO|nr:Uncharacterized protein TCAP_03020 [Tolypocladium capitatum]